MDNYIMEVFDNDLFKVKHIAGKEASDSAKQSFHPCHRLIFSYCIKNGGNIIIDGTKYDISDGDLFIMKPSEFFRHNIDDSCFHERIVLIISMQIIKNLPSYYSAVLSPFFKRKNGVKNHIPCHIVKKHGLDKLFTELLDHSKENDEAENVLAFSRVLDIAATANKIIKKELSLSTENISRDSKANDIMRYLNCNFTKDISIADIACHFNMDKTYLSKIFKKQTGMSVWEYVIIRRIYLFNYLIKDSNSAEEVSYKAGFRNYSNFYRLYKKYMGITPTEFKNSLYISE